MKKNVNNPMQCGAKTRSGRECMARVMPNGQCRMHGGSSPGAPRGEKNGNYKHGYWTKEAIQNRKNSSILLKALAPEI